MDYFHPEVWLKIFLKLPAKTLVRCICVCISWKKFIQDPYFIFAHLKIQRRDLMLLQTCPKEHGEKGDFTIHCDDESFSFYAKLEFPYSRSFNCHYRIIWSFNGILCITSGMYSMDGTYLWNPMIHKFLELPLPRVRYELHRAFEHELGFGYDAKTNDYKVVKIVEIDTCGYDRKPLEVELYNLSSGIWRNISHLASSIKYGIYGWAPNAYLNEAAHWVARSSQSMFLSQSVIISFHFGQEIFRCFETPAGISCPFPMPSNLYPVVVQGSLSLVERCDKMCIIWMMKEYGNSSSWKKWLDINLYNRVDRVIGFRKKSELFIQIKEKLYSFDHKEAGDKELNILSEFHLGIWKLIQQGHIFENGLYFSRDVNTYDPKAAPKDLNIQTKINCSYDKLFYCEKYIGSLVLIGKSTVTDEADQCQRSGSKSRRSKGGTVEGNKEN